MVFADGSFSPFSTSHKHTQQFVFTLCEKNKKHVILSRIVDVVYLTLILGKLHANKFCCVFFSLSLTEKSF